MILLDTCTLLWLSENPPRLPQKVIELIQRAPPQARFISAISVFEIGVKHQAGKLELPKKTRLWIDETCAARGIEVLPISKTIACRATEFPLHHKDPADRIIISTALEHGLLVLTPDVAFSKYRTVQCSWA